MFEQSLSGRQVDGEVGLFDLQKDSKEWQWISILAIQSCQTNAPTDLNNTLLPSLKQLFSFSRLTISVINAEGTRYKTYVVEEQRKERSLSPVEAPLIAGIVGKAVQQQRQIYHEHYSSCAPAQADWGDPDMEDGALASLICCPLIHQGTVLGALTMGVPSANQYITDTLNTASMVSTILAAMLDRWKRIHQLHQSQRAALNIAQDIEASRAELQKSSEALHERSEALQNSNRDLESFAYAASHDLQEPLRKIIGFTELLEAELGSQLKEVPLEYMGYIKLSAQRMTHLIQGLLKYSRAATAVHELESCNLNSLFEDAIDALSLSIAQSGAKIEWHGELPILLGYPVLLRQLFQNLLENAIKFRGDQPLMIEVQSQRVNHEGAEYYQVSVSGMT